MPSEKAHSGCPDPTQATGRLVIVLVSGIQMSGTGDNNLSNGKGHFGPTDRDKRTGQSGPHSKLVPNITVGLNRNGPFHLMYQPKFPEFWVEWKARHVFKKRSKSLYHFVASKATQSQWCRLVNMHVLRHRNLSPE